MIVVSAEPGDMALVRDSFLQSMRDSPAYAWLPGIRMPSYDGGVRWKAEGPYFRYVPGAVDQILAQNTVLVARPSDKQDEGGRKDIAGWICGRRDAFAPREGPAPVLVHWLFVKKPFRNFGIAKDLLRGLGWAEEYPIVATNWSEACENAAPGTLFFIPSLFTSKQSHGQEKPCG